MDRTDDGTDDRADQIDDEQIIAEITVIFFGRRSEAATPCPKCGMQRHSPDLWCKP